MDEKHIILVVEDDKNQSDYMIKIINSVGLYEAIPAYNGRKALECIQENQYGLFKKNKIKCILLDWQMPIFSGEQFIRNLRNKQHTSLFKGDIPVVIISAYSGPERKNLALDPIHGRASAYLQKPFEKTKLESILEDIVIRNQAEVMRDELHTHLP